MLIDKDTKIFCSFAKTAGNNGCRMFNSAFDFHRLNYIYKSFSINNIEEAVKSARTLNFGGFAITMPYKKEVLKYVDKLTKEVSEIGACNTVINNDGKLVAYNTDYLAAKEYLEIYYHKPNKSKLYILGNGGYSAAVQYAAKILNINYEIITRSDWNVINEIQDCIIYNCTPVENIKTKFQNTFIDCIVTTNSGYKLSLIQASHQFKLYTNGLKFPFYEKDNIS
jgi:shikimate 5-dehydrogenase